jgi:ACT domain
MRSLQVVDSANHPNSPFRVRKTHDFGALARTPALSPVVLIHAHRGSRILDNAASRRTSQPIPEVHRKEVPTVPIAKEFTIRQEDKPGTLGKLCHALADKNVNILAFQSFPVEKGSKRRSQTVLTDCS